MRLLKNAVAAWVVTCLPLFAVHAQSIILDEEFSQACTQLTQPLRATLAPGVNVKYVLVANDDINAFVTGENVIYVHSGLVLKAKTASELQGVLAHELGHVSAHHILQSYGNARQAQIQSLAGMVLGMGAMVAGAPQAGAAIALGGQAAGISNFLAHTRTQEQEADRYAINALHAAGYSVSGMVDMFSTLRTESQLSYDAPPPWLVTHPLPPERLSNLEEVKKQEQSGLKTPESSTFRRLQAKVMALTSSPGSTLRHYGGTSDIDRYARSLAYMAQGKLAEAQDLLTPLLKAQPNDAFYQEAAAQIAQQKGNVKEAARLQQEIISKHPTYLIIRYQWAENLRALDESKAAMAQYEQITREWPIWSEPWHGLGLTYGQQGRLAESHLALATAALYGSDIAAARQSLALAKTYLKKQPDDKIQGWADSLEQRLKEEKSS